MSLNHARTTPETIGNGKLKATLELHEEVKICAAKGHESMYLYAIDAKIEMRKNKERRVHKDDVSAKH